MNDIIDLIVSNGMSVVIIGYFIFKDWKINTNMMACLTELTALLHEWKKDKEDNA